MTKETYKWTDNPTVSGVSVCDTDVLNDCLMHLKYDKKDSSGGYNLFDIKITDHILTGDEAAGWLLQGSLVTMTYPDAVNRIKALYADAVETTFRGISCKQTIDGRYIADISQETEVDKLFVSTGVSDFYVLDEANNQFYLPKTKAFMQFTNNPEEVNDFIEAGLPNITGKSGVIGLAQFTSISGSGALKVVTGAGGMGSATNHITNPAIEIDASLSNPIYGNSNTVQPLSSCKLLYYNVGNTIVSENVIDTDNIVEDIKIKADINLSNVTNPSYLFKNMSVSWAVPDYKNAIDLEIDFTERTYIVPSNGYINIQTQGFNGAWGYIEIDGTRLINVTWNSANGLQAGNGFYRVRQGQVCKYQSYILNGFFPALMQFIPMEETTNVL